MRNTVAHAVFCNLIVAMLVLSPFSLAENEEKLLRPCSISNLSAIVANQCRQNERCVKNENDNVGRCKCLIDYELSGDECVPVLPKHSAETTTDDVVSQSHSAQSGGSSVAAALLIPTALIFVAALLYYGARRYKWLQRLRQYHQSRYGNVLVTRDDDDDDDPPIA